MPAHRLKFYFDYNSPYSYFASTQIEALCERTQTELLWLPVVLGGIFKAREVTPPYQLPYRRNYLTQDMEDLAEYYQVPYKHRTEFLFHPILSLRATYCVPQGQARGKAVHALFSGAFARDLDLGDPAVVADLLDQAGFDGKALVEQTGEQAIKDELKATTEQAIADGAFGAPTMVVDDRKLFWGQDRLPLLERYLKSG